MGGGDGEGRAWGGAEREGFGGFPWGWVDWVDDMDWVDLVDGRFYGA